MSLTGGLPATPRPAPRGAPGAASSLALRALAVLVVSAGLAAAITALTSSGGGDAPPAAAAAAAIRAVPLAQAASFAILRGPHRASDSFAQIRAGAGPFGANPALARTAIAPPHPGGVVPRLVSVVPARGHLCLRVLEAVGLAQWWCAPTAAAARGRLIVVLAPPSRRPNAATRQFVVGLVPDGVRSVTITAGAGRGHKLAVRRNVYATAIYEPERVALRLPGGGSASYGVRI